MLSQLEEQMESRSHIIFIESVLVDQTIVQQNLNAAKRTMPDYEGLRPEAALDDFKQRIAQCV